MRIAVVGAGIAGLGAAWSLSRRHHVTLYESGTHLGGHARTIDVEMGQRTVPVDTGFIVYNERNYPNLGAFFDHLGVPTEPSDMSFSVASLDGGFEFGGRLGGLFAQKRNLVRPEMWGVVRGILRFRGEKRRMQRGIVDPDLPLATYLETEGYPAAFGSHYLLPLAAAVWSGAVDDVGAMPIGTFLRFLDNHGLVSLDDRPSWRTVSGGSRVYVERAARSISDILIGRPVRQVARRVDGLVIGDAADEERVFDHVVMATHADAALRILGDAATWEERDVLSAFRYADNRAVAHRDVSLMPRRRSVWSSWNSMGVIDAADDRPVGVTYWMNRLQNLDPSYPVFVSLNPILEPDPRLVLDEVQYDHPQFDAVSERAQRRLGDIQGADRIWFSGAYAGHGFHEDGLQAGLTVAAALGSPAPWADRITPMSPAAEHAAPRMIRVGS